MTETAASISDEQRIITRERLRWLVIGMPYGTLYGIATILVV